MTIDDFRNGLDDQFDYIEEDKTPKVEPVTSPKLFLGMTPVQRFVIVIMLLMMVCILSSFCLLVTDKIALPFL
ncbi:MAG: hypothetical protein B6I38_00610 [Anaerolineaceae bacterium 4572_5.1]|nr:MAG: hypothetical protein B6I38_00610 [Anaerolineaceae bacterium 4572_5.1]RLD07289.1 MAG: hypothetical protein DRI56_06935 [Chloroflexota bacterium]